VTIFDILLIDLQGTEFTMDVYCSKGTYIRTLAEDIGAALGCGAHITALRRTSVGALDDFPLHTLAELEETLATDGVEGLDALLLPMERALPDWPAVRLSEDASYYLSQGQAVFVPQVKDRGWVRLFAGDQRFLGLGTVLDDGRVAPKRLLKHQ
jgi:tRNA pseudouridine55 synthase